MYGIIDFKEVGDISTAETVSLPAKLGDRIFKLVPKMPCIFKNVNTGEDYLGILPPTYFAFTVVEDEGVLIFNTQLSAEPAGTVVLSITKTIDDGTYTAGISVIEPEPPEATA